MIRADRRRTFAACSPHQAGERKSRAMTMKERLKVHAEIVRENARKLKAWKERGRAA